MTSTLRSSSPLRRVILRGTLAVAAWAVLPAQAQPLNAIKAHGTLVVGVQGDFPP